MNRFLAAFVLMLSPAASLDAALIDDVEFWVGDGVNQSVLVIDWLDGRDPLAWGYRWDGAAKGADALFGIVAADEQLLARIGPAGGFGVPVYGLGYDRNANGFALDDGTLFTDGIAVTDPSDTAMALDAADSYREGWNNGFWSSWIAVEDPYTGGGEWGFAPTGPSDLDLTSGDYYGWSFAADFASVTPGVPMLAVDGASVPEPGGFLLVGAGVVAFAVWRRLGRGSRRPHMAASERRVESAQSTSRVHAHVDALPTAGP